MTPSTAAVSPFVALRGFLVANAIATTAVIGFLFWLVYQNDALRLSTGLDTRQLPAMNAGFNAASAGLTAAALWAIRTRHPRLHAGLMLAALAASACFLVGYVVYHFEHGDTRYTGEGLVRLVYFGLLISHVLLSMVVLPLILSSVFLAATRRFLWHKRLSKYTWSVWMYVSVSGVLVYFMLHG